MKEPGLLGGCFGKPPRKRSTKKKAVEMCACELACARENLKGEKVPSWGACRVRRQEGLKPEPWMRMKPSLAVVLGTGLLRGGLHCWRRVKDVGDVPDCLGCSQNFGLQGGDVSVPEVSCGVASQVTDGDVPDGGWISCRRTCTFRKRPIRS